MSTIIFPVHVPSFKSSKPVRSSPLAPLNLNIMASQSSTSQKIQSRRPIEDVTNTFAQRYQESVDPSGQLKLRSLHRAGGDALRRNMSQERRASRDSARFEARGEQMLRIDWMRQRRTWEEELAKRAPDTRAEEEEEMDTRGNDTLCESCNQDPVVIKLMRSSAGYLQPPDEDTEVLDYELDPNQPLESSHDTIGTLQQDRQHHQSNCFGSDEYPDEEAYDQIFLKAFEESADLGSWEDKGMVEDSSDAVMDTSNG